MDEVKNNNLRETFSIAFNFEGKTQKWGRTTGYG
jgi:hypothetical protein